MSMRRRPMRSASSPVLMTDAAIARVCIEAARAWSPPTMSRPRLAPTSAVAAMLGAEPCTAARMPRRGMASAEVVRTAGVAMVPVMN